jgi:hypothetical protein
VIKIWKYMVENMGKVREDLGLFNQDFKFWKQIEVKKYDTSNKKIIVQA